MPESYDRDPSTIPLGPVASNFKALPVLVRNQHESIMGVLKKIHFRQSFIKDYMTCPLMSLFHWVAGMDTEDAPFFSGTMGTAGHYVIYNMHEARKFDYNRNEILGLMEKGFNDEVEKLSKLPKLSLNHDSLQDQFSAQVFPYVEMLEGYQSVNENRKFYSTVHEQSFVLVLQGADGQLFYMTGQIDQAGFYEDGVFSMRDIKFRQSSFRPSHTQLNLDYQMTIYAAGLKYGTPTCDKCRPYYNQEGEPCYDGPCETCAAKIGKPEWPQRFPEKCQLVWLRDFERYKKDEFAPRIKDPSGRKVKNPTTGRMIIAEMENPKYDEGYKKGDFKGKGFINTTRTPSQIGYLLSDVVQACMQIRNGAFYRNPGSHCDFWCKYVEPCVRGMKIEVDDVDTERALAFATHDPFGEG